MINSWFIPLISVFIIIALAMGTYILHVSARVLAVVPNLTWKKSFFVCVVSLTFNFSIWYFIGFKHLSGDFFELLLLNLILLTIIFLVVGKFIWKCTWLQSLKSILIWVIVYTVLAGNFFSEFSFKISAGSDNKITFGQIFIQKAPAILDARASVK